MIFGGCSSEEDIMHTTEAVTYNADGSFTLRAITNVGLPGNYATTRSATYNTDNGLGDKTSWTVGDRLHLDYNNGTEHIYRYATLQSDGSTWKLNDALTINGTNNLNIYYFGSQYNAIDFNDVTTGPSGTSSGNNDYDNTTNINRLNNTFDYLLYIPQTNETKGCKTFSDILSASGDSDIIQASDGKLAISLKHKSNRIAITSADVSSFGSGIIVSSITVNITKSDNTTFANLGVFATSGDEQPSTSMPWHAQVNDRASYLAGFTVTLSDSRTIYVPVPDENGSTTGNGRNINGVSGKIFTYRLTMGPGCATASPDAGFTAPGWNSTTKLGLNSNIIPIYDRAGLEAIANNLGGNYILMNDIDLSGKDWTPIGLGQYFAFTGHFDGNGHKITGMRINSGSYDYNSLFGYIWIPAIIYNVHLVNPIINNTNAGSRGSAGIVGSNQGCIFNCSVTGGTISSTTTNNIGSLGTIAAEHINYGYAKIIHCRAIGTTISQSGNCYAGGIVGKNYIGEIIACYTNGCTINGAIYQGGIVGYNSVTNGIFGCYSAAPNITGTGTNGIIGNNDDSGTMSSCYGTNATGLSLSLSGTTSTLTNCVEPKETDRTNLVSSTAPTLDDVNIVRGTDGTLSIVSRTWKATGLWGYNEGSTIYSYPNIVWNYEGE